MKEKEKSESRNTRQRSYKRKKNRKREGFVMAMASLAHLAAMQVPYDKLETATVGQRKVINFVMADLVRRSRFHRRSRLSQLCLCQAVDTRSCQCRCHQTRVCLCYFTVFRDEMIDEYWGTPDEYQKLHDWC